MNSNTDGIGSEEQIAEGPAQEISDPPLCQMVRAVMDHVAALAQTLEVTPPVVARVMVEMGRSQHDAGVSDLGSFDEIGPRSWAAAAITPGVLRGIKPAPVA